MDSNRMYEDQDTNELRRLYADTLNKSLEIFVSYAESDVENIISKALRPVSAATGLDRIIVFRILNRGSMTFGEKYRWDRLMGGTAPVDEALRELPVNTAVTRWISIMRDDSCISLRRSDFAEDEADFLSPRGVKSILIVPVFTESEFWGVVTYHDNLKERDFDKDCVDMLRSVARVCASTIIRADKNKDIAMMMEDLRRRQEMTDTLNKVSLIFLSQNEEKFSDTMSLGVNLITGIAGIDRLILYRNRVLPDGLRMSQVYRWDRDSGGTAALVENFTDMPYAKLIPAWEEHLAQGNYVNSPSRLLPGREADVLKEFGILTVAVIPIHINNIFWGFTLFGDVLEERCFDDDIIEMMRSAAFLFANAFIRSEMEYDGLTGVYNRRYFDESIRRIMNTLSRSGALLTLMMIDIDFFKLYNDTYGHLEGDKCLKAVAQILSQGIRTTEDMIARYGGEEFVVVLPNTNERGAQLIAERLLNDVRSRNIEHKQSEVSSHVTVSIGVVTGRISAGNTAEDFVKKADDMMYQSKHNGRDRYTASAL